MQVNMIATTYKKYMVVSIVIYIELYYIVGMLIPSMNSMRSMIMKTVMLFVSHFLILHQTMIIINRENSLSMNFLIPNS